MLISHRHSLAPQTSPASLFSQLSESYLQFKDSYEVTLQNALSNCSNEDQQMRCLRDSLGLFLPLSLPHRHPLELSRQDRFPESLELLSRNSQFPSTPSLSFRPSRYPYPSPALSVNSLDTFEQRQTTPRLAYRLPSEQLSNLDHPSENQQLTQEFYEELESPEILVGGESQLNRFTSLDHEPRKILERESNSPQSASNEEVATSSRSHVTLRSHSRQHQSPSPPPETRVAVEAPRSSIIEPIPAPEVTEDSQETQSATPLEEDLQLSAPTSALPTPVAVFAPSSTTTPLPPTSASETSDQSEPKPDPPKAKRIASKDHSILVSEQKRGAKTLSSKETTRTHAQEDSSPKSKSTAPVVAAPKKSTNPKNLKADAKVAMVASSSSSSGSDSDSDSGSDSDSDGSSSSGSDSSSEGEEESQATVPPAMPTPSHAPVLSVATEPVVKTEVPTPSQPSSGSQESSGSESDSSSGSSGSGSDSSESSGSDSDSSGSSSDDEESPKQEQPKPAALSPMTPIPSRSVRFSEKSPVTLKIVQEDSSSDESDSEQGSQSQFQTPSKDTLQVP
jgi:hypothetical protein